MADTKTPALPDNPRPVEGDNFPTETIAGWRSSILESIGVRILRNHTENAGTINRDSVISASEPQSAADPLAKTLPQPIRLAEPTMKTPIRRHGGAYKYLALSAIVGLIVYSGFFLLRLDRKFPALASKLPWPVAYVDGSIVSWHDLQVSVQSLEQYLISLGLPVPSDPDELERSALRYRLENMVIDRELVRSRVSITPDSVDREYKMLENGFGTAFEFENFLQTSYEMGISEFKASVLAPLVRRAALEKQLGKNKDALAIAEQRASELYRRITAGEVQFSEAARAVSDDSLTSQLGGDLGWFQRNNARSEISETLAELSVGQVSEPIETDEGYYILKLEDVADGEDGPGTENVHVSQILIKPVTIDRWLHDSVARFTVVRFIPM